MAQSNQDLHPNWRALATIHIPLKRFIREGSLSTARPGGTHRKADQYEVNCGDGETVRKFYEDLTQNDGEKKPKGVQNKVRNHLKRAKPTETRNDFDKSKFFRCATCNNLKEMQQFDLKEGDIDGTDQYGWSALMMASCEGHRDIVEFLLQKGANRDIRDRSGRTASDLALKKGFLSIVKLLKRDYFHSSKECEQNLVLRAESTEETEPFYCEICRQTFSETSKKKHYTSTIHQFNTKTTNGVNKLQKFNIPHKNRGLQLMVKQGWDKESGLGPSHQGRLYPVKTVIRKTRTGLGIDQEPARVTHFSPFDTKAVERKNAYHLKSKKRSRNDIRSEKIRDWKQNRRLRNALN